MSASYKRTWTTQKSQGNSTHEQNEKLKKEMIIIKKLNGDSGAKE